MSKAKFYLCEHCKNLVGMINYSGVPIVCCGEKMVKLIPNTSEAAGEKHLPVVSVDGNRISVNIGSVNHPMSEEHSIVWIYLESEKGGQRKILSTDGAPACEFVLTQGDKPVAVYAYCNLHGLWKTEL